MEEYLFDVPALAFGNCLLMLNDQDYLHPISFHSWLGIFIFISFKDRKKHGHEFGAFAVICILPLPQKNWYDPNNQISYLTSSDLSKFCSMTYL